MSKMYFRQIMVGEMKNFVYLFGGAKSNSVIVFDCGFEPEKIIAAAATAKRTITDLFLTHVHYDHSGAADKLQQLTGCNVWMHADSQAKRGKRVARGAWVVPESARPLAGLQEINTAGLIVQPIAAPGHQNDHLIYRINQTHLVTGDVLFIGTSGRTDFPDSSPDSARQTLQMLTTQPDELIVCPGHDYGELPLDTLGRQKLVNPALHLPQSPLKKSPLLRSIDRA